VKSLNNSFNPSEFLNIARQLLLINDLDEKGKFRTSIGRAYYSAFLSTRTRLEREGKRFGSEGQHKKVRDLLKSINMHHMADQLLELFDYRRDADYYLSDSINRTMNAVLCNKCILIAEKVIEEIEDIAIK